MVSGYYKGTVDFGGVIKTSNSNSQDIFMVKCDKFGGLMWVQSYGGPNGDYSGSVTITPGNDIILAASFSISTQIGPFAFVSNGGIDAVVVYTNSTGVPLWVIKMGGTGSDQAYGITASGGEILCSGLFNGTADFSGITANSNGAGDAFLVKISTGTPLPVQLILFDATVNSKNNSVICNWTTASEINNNFFTLEKSVDGIAYQKVAVVTADLAPSSYHSYSFTDAHPLTGLLYYRLSQTDLNGTSRILKTVSVSFKNKGSFTAQCYPSVSNGDINILANKLWNEIKVLDTNGSLVRNVFYSSSSIQLNLSDLKKGIYFIQCIAGDEMDSQKIIIQ